MEQELENYKIAISKVKNHQNLIDCLQSELGDLETERDNAKEAYIKAGGKEGDVKESDIGLFYSEEGSEGE